MLDIDVPLHGEGMHCEEVANLEIEAGAPSEEPIDLEEHELQSEAARLKAEMARLKLENEGLKSSLGCSQ